MKKVLSRMFSTMLAIGIACTFQSAEALNGDYILDNVDLKPTYTGYHKTDNEVKYVLSQILTPEMTTSQKVKTCYDWLINNCSYGRKYRQYTMEEYQVHEYLEAYNMIVLREGVCDDYAGAFAAMVRAIGLDCRVVSGETERASGGMTGHAWNVIIVDGVEYVFDAQIDDNIAKGGPIGYYRYCKTYDELPGSYSVYGYKEEFPPVR